MYSERLFVVFNCYCVRKFSGASTSNFWIVLFIDESSIAHKERPLGYYIARKINDNGKVATSIFYKVHFFASRTKKHRRHNLVIEIHGQIFRYTFSSNSNQKNYANGNNIVKRVWRSYKEQTNILLSQFFEKPYFFEILQLLCFFPY